MMEQMLSGVNVLDFTHYVAGPYCTKLLADYGADVIKVERPGRGDGARRLGPFFKDRAHLETSGLFLHLNTDKRGVTVNLKSAKGIGLIKELVGWADIVVESFRPGVMGRLGLSYETLLLLNPRLLMVSISNFGQTGPYRDFNSGEIMGYAMGGMMHATGLPDREPLKMSGRVGLYQAGAMAAVATVTSLYGCQAEECGDYLDLSIMETQAGSIDRRANCLLAYQYTGETYPRSGPSLYSGNRPTQDGYVELWAVGHLMSRLVGALDCPRLKEDVRFSSLSEITKPENMRAFEEHVLAWCMEHTNQEIWQRAQEARVPSGPVNTMDVLFADSHFRGRGVWEKVDRRYTGDMEYPGRPFTGSETAWEIRRPAPLLGQHNREVFCDMLGYTPRELTRFREMAVI